MTKSDLVEVLFEQGAMGDTRVGVERGVNAILAAIGRGLKRDKKVQIVGFGSFEVRKRKARVGRNPQTGESIKIAASRTVAFKAGEPLRQGL